MFNENFYSGASKVIIVWLIDWMVFYAAFNSISVVSLWQLIVW